MYCIIMIEYQSIINDDIDASMEINGVMYQIFIPDQGTLGIVIVIIEFIKICHIRIF